jgi:hypothetical protein
VRYWATWRAARAGLADAVLAHLVPDDDGPAADLGGDPRDPAGDPAAGGRP